MTNKQGIEHLDWLAHFEFKFLGLDQIHTSLGAVHSPPASPVLVTPRGSMSSNCTSCLGVGLVLDPLRDNVQLACGKFDRAISKVDSEFPVDDNKRFVGIVVTMPDKVALQFDDLELIVVHLRNDFRSPLLTQEVEFPPMHFSLL